MNRLAQGLFSAAIAIVLSAGAVWAGSDLPARTSCSSIALIPTCCACNSSGACIDVEHNGVASCTFEFCSSTSCSYS